jgi:putative ATP-dependent endonuclease of OLD family
VNYLEIAQLIIKGFRGIKNATIDLKDYTVLVGPNSCGKSTIIDSLALIFGRDRMVRHLTEHDFNGSNPTPDQRIQIVATLVGFTQNDPELNSEWFREGRAIPKWYNPNTKIISPQKTVEEELLCVQIGYCARFDLEELSVESVKYFHDDEEIEDPFNEDVIVRVPGNLLSDVGFFLVQPLEHGIEWYPSVQNFLDGL